MRMRSISRERNAATWRHPLANGISPEQFPVNKRLSRDGMHSCDNDGIPAVNHLKHVIQVARVRPRLLNFVRVLGLVSVWAIDSISLPLSQLTLCVQKIIAFLTSTVINKIA